jgi:hypothetical protein
LWPFWSKWEADLSQGTFDAVTWSQEIRKFVDSAGKEAIVRRKRLYQLVSFTANFFRDAILLLAGADAVGSAITGHQGLVQFLGEARRPDAEEALQHCVEICLQTCEDIERNANLTILIDDWITALWQRLNAEKLVQP